MEQKNQRYLKIGLTIFLSLAATIVFFFLIFYMGRLWGFLSVILSALQPVVLGMVIAYLLCPVAKTIEKRLEGVRFARVISVFAALIAALGIVGLFCALVLPQLAASVSDLVAGLPDLLEAQLARLRTYLESDTEAGAAALQAIESIETFLANWIKTNMFSTVSALSNRVISIGSALVNLVVGITVTVYLLLDRERYLAQGRKLLFAVSPHRHFNELVLDALHQTNRIFIGFISGKLLDSLIVGILCFLCLTLLRMPYTLLVSVIVGVTNIIPMFGPFIGAVPSAFLILLVSPAKCVVFLIFVVLLQQLDGNIIGPRILGNSTGLSALYVTVAMLLFGKLFGFIGMIIGVPLFATLYYLVKRAAEYSLRRRKLPTETAAYLDKEMSGEAAEKLE